MGPILYLFFFLVIGLACGVNPNEENELGMGHPTSEHPVLEQNVPDDDDNHDGVDKAPSGTSDSPPVFLKKMLKTHVKPAGNMIILKCKASGFPTPNVTWYKNGETPSRQLGHVRYGQWSLTLEDLVTDDSGIYTCVVCNPLGCIDFNYTLDVVERYHNRPILTEEPQNKTVAFGSNVNFSCKFLSDLNPTIYWLIPAENGTIKTSATSRNPETLNLTNITYDSEGWYTCVAANTLGQTMASAYLKVVDTLEEDSQPQSRLLFVLAAVVTVFTTFAVVVVVVVLRKLKQEKTKKLLALETARAAVITQWTKKVIVEKLENSSNAAEPLVSIYRIPCKTEGNKFYYV